MCSFGKIRWHLESLQTGKLRMNNLKKFVDIKKNEGKKGMGDINFTYIFHNKGAWILANLGNKP